MRYPPLATKDHARNGTRERVLAVAAKYPLKTELDALVTKVLFDGDRAIGVEYLNCAKLYRASWKPGSEPGTTQQAFTSG